MATLAAVLPYVTKLLSYGFVALIMFFIYSMIRMIYSDVETMYQKKARAADKAYVKLVDLRSRLPFSVEESYALGISNTIGRSSSCTISFPDETLSSEHARIFEEDGVFYIEDLGSKNGTLLNGSRISEEDMIQIMDGDKISVGRVTFIFVEVRAEEAK